MGAAVRTFSLDASSPVAVVLNMQARGVHAALVRHIQKRVHPAHLYCSRSLEEAESCCQELVKQRYQTIVCGGGDGTLIRMVNGVRRARLHAHTRGHPSRSMAGRPRFAFLNLGTGNALQRVVGAQDPLEDLERILTEDPKMPLHTLDLPLIRFQNEHFLFAGLGYDSMLLNDYNVLKHAATHPFLKRMARSLGGYVLALIGRTLPRLLGSGLDLIGQVVTTGSAYYIDPRRGDAIEALAPGTVLFDGAASLIGVGTTPFFGYGFRVFPFARLSPHLMHLRVATMTPLRTLAHLPSLWKGHYRNMRYIFDFLVQEIDISLQKPFSFQHSGDGQGPRQNLHLKTVPKGLRLVDFYSPSQENFGHAQRDPVVGFREARLAYHL